MNIVEDLRDVHWELFHRYKGLIDGDETSQDLIMVREMCDKMLKEGRNVPVDKMARWCGFVQGILWMYGLIDIDEERDFSRPLFTEVYDRYEISYQTIVLEICDGYR